MVVNQLKNYLRTVLKVAGTHIFASWLCSTSFAGSNTGRTDVVKLATGLRCDSRVNDFDLKSVPSYQG